MRFDTFMEAERTAMDLEEKLEKAEVVIEVINRLLKTTPLQEAINDGEWYDPVWSDTDCLLARELQKKVEEYENRS